MARRSLVLVDDFYADPSRVRRDALSLDYDITGRFPGRNSPNVNETADLRRIARMLRMNIEIDRRSRDVAFFRLTRGTDVGACDIHVDPSGWAGVCYLNAEGPSNGGTSFFQHKSTGLRRWPSDGEVEDLRDRGILDVEVGPGDLSAYFIEEGKYRDRWQEIATVPPTYNRAVFYDAQQFHAITDWSGFGTSDQDARLVRLFFFSEQKAAISPPSQVPVDPLAAEG